MGSPSRHRGEAQKGGSEVGLEEQAELSLDAGGEAATETLEQRHGTGRTTLKNTQWHQHGTLERKRPEPQHRERRETTSESWTTSCRHQNLGTNRKGKDRVEESIQDDTKVLSVKSWVHHLRSRCGRRRCWWQQEGEVGTC